MTNERRGGRRPPPRPGGGGHGEFRPYRPRPSYGAPEEGSQREFQQRPPSSQGRGGYAPRPPARSGGYQQRPATDEGGMAIRVDPRRLGLLKELAAAEGLRPGQLVQRWVEERLDAERSGAPVHAGAGAVATDRVQALEANVATLTSRVDELVASLSAAPEPASPTAPQTEAHPRRRGRPRKRPLAQPKASATGKVALHDEIIAVIGDRGPSTAAELATAIRERGQYQPPRSAKPLDAATVNSRVSNRVYRARFRRSGGKISLAD